MVVPSSKFGMDEDEELETISLGSLPSISSAPSSRTSAKQIVSVKKAEPDFYIDKRGDWEVLRLGIPDRSQVPSHSIVFGQVLGEEKPKKVIPAKRSELVAQQSVEQLVYRNDPFQGDVIRLEDVMTVTSFSTDFLEKQRQLNMQLAKHPSDVRLWLRLVAFQDQLQECLKLSRKVLAERKHAILQRAMHENPQSEEIFLVYLRLLPDLGYEMTRQMSEWAKVTQHFPCSETIWKAFLHFQMSSVHLFFFTEVIEQFMDQWRRFGNRQFLSFLMATGYSERAISILGINASLSNETDEALDVASEVEQINAWLRHEMFLERKFWFPRKEKAKTAIDDPIEDYEREVLADEVAPFLNFGYDAETLLSCFGLPAMHSNFVPCYPPLAWSDVDITISDFGDVLTKLPVMPVETLIDSPVSLLWSLGCDPLGQSITLDPFRMLRVRLPESQLGFVKEYLRICKAKSTVHQFYENLLGAKSEGAAYGRFLNLAQRLDEAEHVYLGILRTEYDVDVMNWVFEMQIRMKNLEKAKEVLICLDCKKTSASQIAYRFRNPFYKALWDLLEKQTLPVELPNEKMLYVLIVASYLGIGEYSTRFFQLRELAYKLWSASPLDPSYFAITFLIECANLSDGRFRARLDELRSDYPESHASHYFALHAEMVLGNVPRVRDASEKAVECMPWCSSFWHLYMQLEHMLAKVDRVKAVSYRAIRSCPYAKDLYLRALTYLKDLLSYRESIDLITTMEEKELRVRCLLEEFVIIKPEEEDV